jgi:hypothetical protein
LLAEDSLTGASAHRHVPLEASGSHTRFRRDPKTHQKTLDEFFERTGRDYQRFNYLGEWHSHPSFSVQPSVEDIETMTDDVLLTRPRTLAATGEKRDGALFFGVPGDQSGQLTFERSTAIPSRRSQPSSSGCDARGARNRRHSGPGW